MDKTPMAPVIDHLKGQTWSEWTDPATVSTWRKWDPKCLVQSRDATDALVQAARIADGLSVLDIASGTGEPAITLAKAVGPNGHVMATDIARGMLDVAEENAHQAALSNISFQQADAHSLPFPDEIFDRGNLPFWRDVFRGYRSSVTRDPKGVEGWRATRCNGLGPGRAEYFSYQRAGTFSQAG